MSSTKSERHSRRSSILKVSKSRQPLQNVELNASSMENSPTMSTTKIKRRVSFAEKKHVKEFCDSMEQGTVWDTTYEESELSQRNSQNSNNNENVGNIEFGNVPSKNNSQANIASKTIDESVVRESILTGVKSRHSSSVSTENRHISEDFNSRAVERDSDIADSVFKIVHVEPTRIPYPSNHFGSFKARRSLSVNDGFTGQNTIEEKTSFRARADSCPAIIDSPRLQVMCQGLSNFEPTTVAGEDDNDVVPMDETIIGDVSVELTVPVSTATRSLKGSALRSSSIAATTVFVNDDPLPNHLLLPLGRSIVNAKFDEESLETAKDSAEQPKFTIFHDTSMEMTVGVSHLSEVHHPTKFMSVESNEESSLVTSERTMFEMKTMEFTEAVSTTMDHSKARLHEFDPKEPDLRPERSINHNESMDFTEVVQMTHKVERSREPPAEKTTIFHDKSVEFTDIVRNIPSMEELNKSPLERTTMFLDKSVDFTDVIENIPTMKRQEKSSPERTTIFHNKSVDFTQVVQNIPNTNQQRETPSGPTTIFHNESLDFTEMVPGVRSMEKSLCDNPEPERAAIFRNRSVDLPEVDASIERSQFEKSHEESETKGRKILQNNQSSELAEVFSRVSSASKSRSRQSSNSFEEKIAKDAESFVPTTEKPLSEDSGSEIQSPLPKRSKSLGNNSIDFTAALPFIRLRRLKIQRCNEISDDEPTTMPEVAPGSSDFEPIAASRFEPEETDSSEKTTTFQNQSMEVTEVVAESFPYEPRSGIVPPSTGKEMAIIEDKSPETTDALPGSSSFEPALEGRTDSNHDDSYRPRNATLLNDESMEITSVIPGIIRAGRIEVGENPTATIFLDQSMEMTVAAFRPPLTRSVAISSETCLPDYGEAKTIVFRDDSMDLTGAVRYLSDLNKEIHTHENNRGKCQLNDSRKFDNDGRTVVFLDDCMELTGAVKSVSRRKTPFTDKENCPVGAEDLRPCRVEAFEGESRIAGSKDQWLGTRKSLPFLSLQKNEENHPRPAESKEESRVANFGPEEITGVVAFSSEIDEEYPDERDFRNSQEEGRTLIFGNEEAEVTGVVPWSSDSKNVHPRNCSSDSPRSCRLAGGMDIFPNAEKIHHRSSQVAKELFQKTISSTEYMEEKAVSANGTGTADLEAEIRKLGESCALEDESGFDQAAFLRQQARCMEDYEANSTASQDCDSAAQSVGTEGAMRVTSESRDTEKSADWEISSNRKAVEASAENGEVSVVESHCYSSKSLEELRCRAYSISKFQPEVMGYELTAAIGIVGSDNFHETIMLEDLQAVEPPSFLRDLAESAQRSVHELPTESEIGGKEIDSAEYREADVTISQTMEDVPNVSLLIPEITMTQTVNMEKIVNDGNNEHTGERTERKKMHRSQSYVRKKPISDRTIFITSSPEIDDETATNCRRSNTRLTTAAEFSSESANGPSEKLRRGENILPIEGKEEKSTKLTNIARCWGSNNFANSTVIVDDLTRQSMHRCIEDTSIIVESSLADELRFDIDTNEEQNVSRSLHAEEVAYDVTMKSEVSLHNNPFDILKKTIKNLAGRLDTIWTINCLDEKLVAFNFFSNSIVLAIYLSENEDASTHPIKVIGLVSQLVEEGTDPGVSLAHSLIMKKVDSASLARSYRTYEAIPQMLDFVSTEVKLGMDFMFELDRLRNRNVMEIHGNRIIFMVRTRDINAGIILNITMEIKPFGEIDCNDITISCILGSEKVRENDIKRLITNVKRDHRFLRFYMNDVKDYVDLMAETGFSTTRGTGCN